MLWMLAHDCASHCLAEFGRRVALETQATIGWRPPEAARGFPGQELIEQQANSAGIVVFSPLALRAPGQFGIGENESISAHHAPGLEVVEVAGEREVVDAHQSVMIAHHCRWRQVAMRDFARGASGIHQGLTDLYANVGYLERRE